MSQNNQTDLQSVREFLKSQGYSFNVEDSGREHVSKYSFETSLPDERMRLASCLSNYLQTNLGIHWMLLWRPVLEHNLLDEKLRVDIQCAADWFHQLA